MKIAITKIGNKSWIGGTTYLKNFTGTIQSKLKDKLKIYLINNGEEVNEIVKKNFTEIISIKNSKWSAFLQIFSLRINTIIDKYSIDVLFESTEFLGFFCKRKVVTWIPDFQHKYYPQYFTFFDYYKESYLIK